MKNKPIFLIFGILFIAVSYLQYRMDARSSLLKGFEIIQTKKERDVRLLSSITETVIGVGRQDVFEGHLNDAIRVRWIDFYMLTYGSEVVFFNSIRPLSDEAYQTLAALHPPEKMWEFTSEFETVSSIRGPASSSNPKIEEFRFLETDLGGGRRLKLGFNMNREAFLAESNELVKDENRRIFVLTILVVLGVFAVTFRDMFKLIDVLRSKGLRGLEEMRSHSRETEILKQGLSGYQATVKRLAHANKILGAQVLPSLRSELQSGRKPPYEFYCTLVRTDINEFTKIFHSHPQDEFLQTINEFFTESSHVISRYEGLIHEFVGDEIIYYFKDENHRNSFTAALSCARELAEVAQRIHQRTSQKSQPHDFRIKTALAHGSVRFGPLLNGYALAGGSLIETTRILSQVSEKSDHTIHFDSRHLPHLHSGIQFEESFRAKLKGIDGERLILRFAGSMELDQVLGATDKPHISLEDYRQEKDIVMLIRHALYDSRSIFSVEIESLIRKIQVTKCSREYSDGILELLKEINELGCVEKNGAHGSTDTSRFRATFIGSLPNLIPANAFNQDFGFILSKFLNHPESRIVANAIEAMEAFRSTGFANLNKHLLDSPNVRVAANALAFHGKIEISKEVVKRTRLMLQSEDLVRVGAGVYAWGEIVGHHAARDVVYLKTHPEFLGLENKVRDLAAKHPSLKKLSDGAIMKSNGTREANNLAPEFLAS